MTNEAKHTPGPWRLHDMEAATVVQSATGYAIADCNATKYSDSENDANARLIASAPALVAENARLREALGRITTTCVGIDEKNGCFRAWGDCVDIARAALKAGA